MRRSTTERDHSLVRKSENELTFYQLISRTCVFPRGHVRAYEVDSMRVFRLCGAIRRLFASPIDGRGPAVWAAVSLILALISLPLHGQSSPVGEYQSKAKYLSNFPSFVEWSAETWPSEKEPFLICVFGDYPFGTSLAEEARGRSVHHRRVEVKWMRKIEELHSCQILFVTQSEQRRYTQILKAVRGKTMLTVGETPEFLDAGGMVSFSTEDTSIRFDVNLEEANEAHLKLSSRLLALARRVVSHAEAAKS